LWIRGNAAYNRTDNSNILSRAEVLSALSKKSSTKCIVTYPEALSEKVVTKKDLEKNTTRINVGDEIIMNYSLADLKYNPT
jgi:transcription-repair coupling factor (superfamily II helicase)